MKRIVVATIVVLIVVVAFFVRRSSRSSCRTNVDCAPPNVCAGGTCVDAGPSKAPPGTPPGAPPGAPSAPGCPAGQTARIGLVPAANGTQPGPCALSANGKWLLYPNGATSAATWKTGIPGVIEIHNGQTAAACQSFCENNPSCQSWTLPVTGVCYVLSAPLPTIWGESGTLTAVQLDPNASRTPGQAAPSPSPPTGLRLGQ